MVAVLLPCRVQWFGRVIGGRFYSLAGVNGSGVSLGEMSGNDIAMSGGSFLAGVNGSGVSLGEMWCGSSVGR